VLPTFFVIGATKGGTTTLHHWLGRHPDVFVPKAVKDTFFFNGHADADARARYEALFEPGAGKQAVGEVTATYLDDPLAAGRMAMLIPDARVVASLREPLSRAYAMAQQFYRLGRADDLLQETVRLAHEPAFKYAVNLRTWLDAFPRDQFLAIRYDDLAAQPDATASRVFEFIGVDGNFVVPDTDTVHNPGGVPKSKLLHRVIEWRPAGVRTKLRRFVPAKGFDLLDRMRRANLAKAEALPPGLAAELRAGFRDDILETQELLGLDLSSWLAS
jgi:hypothetical protein